jgi:hypothetical protein
MGKDLKKDPFFTKGSQPIKFDDGLVRDINEHKKEIKM